MTNFDLFLLIIYIVQEADKNSKLIDQVREYNFNKQVSNTEFPPIEEKKQKRKFDNFDQNMEIEKTDDLLPRVDQKLITQIDKKRLLCLKKQINLLELHTFCDRSRCRKGILIRLAKFIARQ